MSRERPTHNSIIEEKQTLDKKYRQRFFQLLLVDQIRTQVSGKLFSWIPDSATAPQSVSGTGFFSLFEELGSFRSFNYNAAILLADIAQSTLNFSAVRRRPERRIVAIQMPTDRAKPQSVSPVFRVFLRISALSASGVRWDSAVLHRRC